MIGNDVVDFAASEARAGAAHPRFDARVFVCSEREALLRSDAPTRLRWILWAAKEAAFKAVKRADPATVFSPRRFVVAPLGGAAARVVFADRALDVTLDLRPGYVHAIASLAALEVPHAPGALHAAIASPSPPSVRLVTAVEAITRDGEASPELAGRRVRELAVASVARALDLAASGLAVVREGRLPSLAYRGRVLDAALSLSHHGRFAAFACSLREPRVARRRTG